MPMKRIDKYNGVLEVECNDCHHVHTVCVKLEDFDRYINKGDLVQKVWPTYDTWDRELIIGYRTGFYQCKLCFEKEEIHVQEVSVDEIMNQIKGDQE
jgi:hypothetical protein